MTAAATDRLSRLLALVPYLVSRQGIPLAEAAAEFDISQAQLVKDQELLFVCGTPGHLPDDLNEVLPVRLLELDDAFRGALTKLRAAADARDDELTILQLGAVVRTCRDCHRTLAAGAPLSTLRR